jgi:hypothetical protein
MLSHKGTHKLDNEEDPDTFSSVTRVHKTATHLYEPYKVLKREGLRARIPSSFSGP